MDFQIILLPRQDYWSWVRACRDYVLKFGGNLTPDPETAARYMAPRQVVTFPNAAQGFPEQGDLQAWFLAHHAGVRLDVVEARTPDDLQRLLRQRIETEDRYGEQARRFRLQWPTNYGVITQRFGANPRIYGTWGLPGHEGIDIRAPSNTNVMACADGTVYEVRQQTWGHPYGIHVRLQHRDGYKTVYAHLAKALVQVGEAVKTGQVIGKADSTGNSSSSHLHLTLKRDGATERKETNYPKDIIDPTPFMVWPAARAAKGLGGAWPAGRCLVGAHGRLGGALEEADLELVRAARLEALMLDAAESAESVERLQATAPGAFIMLRLTADFKGDAVSPSAFVDRLGPGLERLYPLGVRYAEVHTAPNLQIEGWQRSWRDGGEFAAWFGAACERLRAAYPDLQLGFPGLSPGERIPGQRAEALDFLEEAEDAVGLADWVGVHAVWTDRAGMHALGGGLLFEEYALRFPDRLLFVTEFCNPSPAVPTAEKARQYLEYLRLLRDRPEVGAAFALALSAVQGHPGVVWRDGAAGVSEIAVALGGRGF